MQILNPEERGAVEDRIGQMHLELKSLSKDADAAESKRADELKRELEELNRKLLGVGPPMVEP